MPIKRLSASSVMNGWLLELGGSCVFLGGHPPSETEGAGKCQCASWSPFLRFSLAVLCPQPRGHIERGKQRGGPPSQFWVSLPRVPTTPLPTLHSSLQQLQGRAKGGTQVPVLCPHRGFQWATQPKPDKEKRRKAGALTKLSAAPRTRLSTCFLPPSLPALLWAKTRSSRPDRGITFQMPKSL